MRDVFPITVGLEKRVIEEIYILKKSKIFLKTKLMHLPLLIYFTIIIHYVTLHIFCVVRVVHVCYDKNDQTKVTYDHWHSI